MRRVLVGVVGIGVLLRSVEYLRGATLWGDEAMIYVNLHRSVAELVFRPLDYFQIAPPLFLILEKLAVLCFGTSEYALRLVPFLASLAALVTFAVWAPRALSGWGAVLAVLLFALSPYLVTYAAEAKQYSTDALATVLLLTATLKTLERPSSRRFRDLGLAGLLLALLSHPAVLTLSVLVVVVALRRLRPPVLLFGLWIGAIGLVGVGSLVVHAPTTEIMRTWWSEGFLRFPPTSGEDLVAYGRALVLFFRHPGGLVIPLSGLLAFALGVWFYSERWRLWVVLSPVLAVAAAGAAGIYPVVPLSDWRGSGRLLVFALPSAILLMSVGVETLLRHPVRALRLSGAVLGGLLVVQTAYSLRVFPEYGDVRPRLKYVAQHMKPGDELVVPPGLLPLADYYAPEFALDTVPILPDGRVARLSPGSRWYLYVRDGTAHELRRSGVRIVSLHQIGDDAVIYYERDDWPLRKPFLLRKRPLLKDAPQFPGLTRRATPRAPRARPR